MTDIIYHEPYFENNKLRYRATEVKELHIHSAGEDGEYLWMEIILKNGNKFSTGYFKELPP